MQALVLPLQKLISQVKDNANAILLSVLVFSYHRAWRYTTSKGSCHFGCVLFRRTVKAVCVGLLWVASVLIDAEWYVCCCNHNPKVVADLQCKAKADITPGVNPVVTIAEMKTNSRMYGISLLFGITLVGAVLLSTWTVCADYCFLQCCKREVLVHELILEVGEDIVSQTMKERQKSILSKRVNDYITQGEWEKCLDVVEDFIDPTGEHSDPVSSISNLTVVTEGQHKDLCQQGEQEQRLPL
ncbi:uncharacterized protein LOC111673391 [Seriola lalandi dorsalis]|uniref:uncharacterized protein LOC111673391 n=1 Tax=Seriola lalandi dorsalis TaxID=1841481 RepID=UPI000C6FBE2F|nr:uncharacterized protein LOC111673391 [Seriola lalandi dorsalis]